MIRFESVTHRYGAHTALDAVDLEVPEHALCVLLGPSGSGKSTLLRLVNRLLEPDAGVVRVAGRDVRSYRPEALRRSIGYVIQHVGLFPHWKVADNVATVPRLLGWGRPRISERVAEVLDLVGLAPATYAGRYPHQLSGGEAQRVGVARALASDPPILLMDEPFSAVDPLGRQRLQAEFLDLHRRLRKTVVFVTHDVDEAVRLGDRLAILKEGRLVRQGATEAILENPADAFVAGFLGADRTLKRLSRKPASDLARPQPAEHPAGPPAGGDLDDALPETTDLRLALSHFLATGREAVALLDARQSVSGWLHRSDLEAWARSREGA
jgi:osmoprotectant transport system ATP-binding protein